jgi:hypothetical protein
MRLFHLSEESTIERFIPRMPKALHQTIQGPVVWAVAEPGLWTYLVPRDCPRITFAAQPETDPGDIERYLDGVPEKKVIALESAWFERCLGTTLYCYELDPARFSLYDPHAHYYLSVAQELPIEIREISSPLHELARIGIEVRITPSLWELRERIFHTSLSWGFIRMRNATPPQQGYEAYIPL